MGDPGPDPAPGDPTSARDRPYGLDDLVAHEKRNMRLVLVVLLGAIAWYALRGRTSPLGDPAPAAPSAPAPVVSAG